MCVCVCVCRLRLCQVQCRAEGQDGPGADGGQPHLPGRGQHGRGTQHLRTGAKQEELCVHREPHMGACYTVGVFKKCPYYFRVVQVCHHHPLYYWEFPNGPTWDIRNTLGSPSISQRLTPMHVSMDSDSPPHIL